MKKQIHHYGFTIVEIIIVIVIIGALTGLVTNAFGGLQDDARDSERKTDVQALASDLESYYSDFGMYPTSANLLDPVWVDDNLTGIEAEVLVDPRGNRYVYTPDPVGCDNLADATECTSYVLTADLEEDGYQNDDEDMNVEDLREDSLHNGQ